MRKKFLSVLLCATMAVSMLAGCGDKATNTSEKKETTQESSKESSSTPSTTTSESKVEEEKPLYPIVDEPITVTGLLINNGRDITNGREVWDMVTEVTGIEFEWIQVDQETLSTYLAGGDWEWDFFHYGNLGSTQINDYGIIGGMLVNYYDYLDVMPNLQQLFKDYPEAEKAVREINGAIYRLPHVETSATATQIRPYYRTDLFRRSRLGSTKDSR